MPKNKPKNKNNLEKSLEKKLNDLEAAVNEINEKLEQIDITSLSNLQEKMEDIEDLIMVEQAGIIELKKLMYGTKDDSGIKAPESIKDMEHRLRKVEHDVAKTLEKKEEMRATGGIEAEEIYKRIDELRSKISTMEDITKDLKDTLEEKGGMDVQGIDLVTPRVEKIEEKIKLLEGDLRKGMVQKFSGVKEKDVAKTSRKFDDIEKIVRNVEESNRKLSSSISSEIKDFNKRLDALEAGYKDEGKYRKELDDFKSKIIRGIKGSKASNTMDTQINELLDKIVSLESKLKVMERNLSKVSKEKPFILE